MKALSKGVLKVMSKMGISTIQSYTGAQVFEAFGLSTGAGRGVLRRTPSRLGGVGLAVLAEEAAARHAVRLPAGGDLAGAPASRGGGEYQWRREGELHLFNPETVFLLQHATRRRRVRGVPRVHREGRGAQPRGRNAARAVRAAVRAAAGRAAGRGRAGRVEIVRRFATGAMSYGSISAEAHETLAIAMNRIGGKSNSGEGGEDARRFDPRPER